MPLPTPALSLPVLLLALASALGVGGCALQQILAQRRLAPPDPYFALN